MNKDKQKVADILVKTGCIAFNATQPFQLTNKRLSPMYADMRRLIGFVRERHQVMSLAANLIELECHMTEENRRFDVVAGGETAGISFAAWIADLLLLPMAYIRKVPKTFGQNQQIEGVIDPGQRVLLVEDLLTEGASKFNFINAIRHAGAQIEHCFVIFNYGLFGDPLASVNVQVHYLVDWWDILDAVERHRFSYAADLRRHLESFERS